MPRFRLFDPLRYEYPDLPAHLIFDAQYLKEYFFANRPVGGAVPSTVSRAASLPELVATLEGRVNVE